MIKPSAFLTPVGRAAIVLAAPVLATAAWAADGVIATLPQGRYVCETAGDAAGPAGIRVPDAEFTVVSASSYETSGGRGTYLLTGDMVTVTSGPKQGERFRRTGSGFLRQLGPDGSETGMRCVRSTANNR